MSDEQDPSSTNKYKVIIKHQDGNSTNLNKKFASYGCDTLEFKVPVVSEPAMTQLRGSDKNVQLLETLRLKQASATGALRGQRPKTRDAVLRLLEINGETIITATPQRDRSPVDEAKLDDDIEAYMQERKRIKALKEQDEATAKRFVAAMTLNKEELEETDQEMNAEDEDKPYLHP